MKIYIIAGEASGDLHGSNLISALKSAQPDLSVRAWGGDLMQQAGAEVVKHYRELAFMGFAEVLMNLRTILRNFKICKQDIEAWKPDMLVLIDYPGFNLRMAEWAHQQGIPVHYYISPQIWAWKQGRVHQIKKFVDKMYVVLPFEQAFYEQFDYKAEFVGHPLLDATEQLTLVSESEFRTKNGLDQRPIIALLPGSRKQEIETMLPLMLKASEEGFADYQIVIAAAPSQPTEFYQSFLQQTQSSVHLISGQTYPLLRYARAGLVTSGTATLEAGIFEMPQVVCYKGNRISYLIARQLVKVKFISLVNLILDREAVRELIQDDLTVANLQAELRRLSHDGPERDRVLADYRELRQKLGGSGASEKTANLMLKSLKPA